MQFKRRGLKAGILSFCLLLTLVFLILCLTNTERIEKTSTALVEVLSEKALIVGGHSIGVKMNVKGVLIVGLEEIESIDGRYVNPGFAAGLEVGDMILEVNDVKVYRAAEVQEEVNNTKGKIELKILRKEDIFNVEIDPVCTKSDGSYKLGVWVKDKTAGIGTLTYYDPETKMYGALGHGITDPETGVVLDVAEGELLNSSVQSVKEGKAGAPGEIRGIFYEAEVPLGKLEKNTSFGVFAKAYGILENPIYSKPMVVGSKDIIEKGKAYILTTLEGNTIQEYEIQIENIDHSNKSGTKNMTIRVTDERLLEKCGGIVQGMSGSPIIQDGKLVGAVTHVLVNDPTRGYGIFIENMLDAAG